MATKPAARMLDRTQVNTTASRPCLLYQVRAVPGLAHTGCDDVPLLGVADNKHPWCMLRLDKVVLFTAEVLSISANTPPCRAALLSCCCPKTTHRMVLPGFLPVCLLYLLLVCSLGDTQDVIVVPCCPDNHAVAPTPLLPSSPLPV